MRFSAPKEGKGMPLLMVKRGMKMRIKSVIGGHGLKAKLAAMGLANGMEIEVVSNNHRGPLIVKVLESRIMLGKGMAHKILVE